MESQTQKRTITSSTVNTSMVTRVATSVQDSTIIQKGREKVSDGIYVGKKLMKSTGKAAWIAATTAVVVLLPLALAWDSDNYLDQMDLQSSLLGPSPSPNA